MWSFRIAGEVKAALEESLDAIDVSVEIVFGIRMIHRDHLREIDEDGYQGEVFGLFAVHDLFLGLFLDEDVELVEISVNETILCQAKDHRYQFGTASSL